MKKINNLIVSGCSFTENCDSWSYIVAEHFNSKLINLAVPGAGNQHISRSVILYLEKNYVSVEDTLILIMWSNPQRTDWISSRKNPEYKKHSRFNYGNNSYLLFPRELLNLYQNVNSLQPGFPELLDLSYYPGVEASATIVWESINHLNLYLNSRGYQFLQTTYFDRCAKIPTNFGISWATFAQVEEVSGLSISNNRWIPLDESEYLGNYVCQKNLLKGDLVHPTEIGYRLWAENILIPKLETLAF